MSGRSGGNGDRSGRLADLGRRIDAARGDTAPEPRAGKDKFAAASMAWRMIFELVVSTMIGAAMGWGLDSLTGLRPLFLIVFVFLGLAAGIRMMMRSAEEMQRRQSAEAAQEDGSHGGTER